MDASTLCLTEDGQMKSRKSVFGLVAGLWLIGTVAMPAPGSGGGASAISVSAANQATGDELWDPRFAYPGLNDMVECVAADGEKVYYGGWFDKAGSGFGSGGVEANGIALWNGKFWSALGRGVSGRVYAIALKGSDVYVGGYFSSAGGTAAKNIAHWDGTKWWPLGTGTDSQVSSIVVIGDTVYVGGGFRSAGGHVVNHVAAWNGTAWSPLGNGVDSSVYAMAASGNDLIVGGDFTSAGGVPANRIARWNGSSWTALGAGVGGERIVSVNALAVAGSAIYAGGLFTTAGGITVNHIARWDGTTWSALGTGMTGDGYASGGYVQSIAVLGNRVYAGGEFLTAGGTALKYLAAWDGSSWKSLAAGIRGSEDAGGNVKALAVAGMNLYAGGGFYGAGELSVGGVARWDGTSWHPLGMGIDNDVFAITSIDGKVFIGGKFEAAGGVQSPRIAIWDGEKMNAVGSGIEGDSTTVEVRAITKYKGKIIAAGSFPTAGGVTVNSIAAWDGTEWSALAGGVTGGLGQVNALAVFDDVLYVGGQFTSAGGISTGGFAKWNGSHWTAVSTGIAGATIPTVEAIAVDGNRMAVAGYLKISGGGASGVALFDGSSWSVLGTTDRWEVYALGFHGGNLYAGGGFNTLGGVPCAGIARYDGSVWSPIGSGIEGVFPKVSAITFHNDDLIVGGNFVKIGGIAAGHIARFDGASWSPLGSGVRPESFGGEVNALATTSSGVLVGGSFDSAGAGPSYNFAIWNPDLAPDTRPRLWLQVASHAAGANQSQWRTDLGLLNPGASAASAELRFHASTGVLSRTQAVQPGQQLILADVLDSFVAAAGQTRSATGSVALEVVSDQPLKVSSRTYNLVASNAACYPRGTFGQNYDAFRPEDGIAVGQRAYLPQLTENAAYRTNIALTNTGTTPANVTVDLFNGAGTKVGSYDVDLGPGQYKQENKPFLTKAGQSNLARGWAQVWVNSGSGVIASASVVDNLTNDPTTLPALRNASLRSWLQVGSHAAGANQSQWRTDLGLLNTDQVVPISVQVRFHKGGGMKSNTLSVAPGQQAILVDVVGQIPETGSAALEIVANLPILVSSRTYNLVAGAAACYPNGTFGQSYNVYPTTRTLGRGATAHLTQLQESPAYRTNIAMTNTGAESANVAVTLYNASGTQIGQYDVALNAGEYKQENRPFFSKAGQTNLAAGYAKVVVTQGTGIIASASVVDNLTNDPTTMPAI
jgi:hypothetical protein